jgi:hypothetical protein
LALVDDLADLAADVYLGGLTKRADPEKKP